MTKPSLDIALSDHRPYFEKALRHAVQRGIVNREKLTAIEAEAPKGMVQIADTFGSKYLRPEIESARKRIVNLVSLYLEQTADGDLEVAAYLIRDNTFLTLSRGGSGLLKALFAMPEYAMMGREEKGHIEDFLEFWSRKEKPQEYRQALAQRQTNALEIEAGYWFGNVLGLSRSLLQEMDVDAIAVVRTAILVQDYGSFDDLNLSQIGFAQLLDAVRSQAAKAGTAKRIKAKPKTAALAIPDRYSDLVQRVKSEILTRDLPKILEPLVSLDKLVHSLRDHYFIRDQDDLEETSGYDALVAKEWTRLTKGKTDIDSVLTLLLCLCAAMPPKTSLTEAAAKTMIRKFRKDGIHPERAQAWIGEHAPHEKQASLLQDWREFLDEANNYLLDDRDPALSSAMRFMRENCQIEKPAKK